MREEKRREEEEGGRRARPLAAQTPVRIAISGAATGGVLVFPLTTTPFLPRVGNPVN